MDDDLWIRVKTRQLQLWERAEAIQGPWTASTAGAALNATHRARYLFSGLLKYAACGANYSMIGKDRYGCANRRNGRTLCSNSKTVGRQIVERRVLYRLRDGLLTEENIRVVVQEMQTEARKARETERVDRTRLEQELKAADASIAALIDLIEQGKAPPSVVERITSRERERDRYRVRLDALGAQPDVVELHPNAAALYARKIDDLAAALNEPSVATDAKDLLRSLVKTVVIEPDASAPDGVALTVHGAQAEVLALCQGTKPQRKNPRAGGHGGPRIVQVSLVAGAGFEPATFRL